MMRYNTQNTSQSTKHKKNGKSLRDDKVCVIN